MDAGLAWGGKVLEGGFGSDGKDLLCCVEAHDAFEGRDGVFAVGRDGFRNLVSRRSLLSNRTHQATAPFVILNLGSKPK